MEGLQPICTITMSVRGEYRVGFININDMYNNDVGKGGVWI